MSRMEVFLTAVVFALVLWIVGGSMMKGHDKSEVVTAAALAPVSGVTDGLRPQKASIGVNGKMAFFVNTVKAGGPAERAGLWQGDVILGVDERQFVSVADFLSFTADEPGTPITLEVLRAETGGLRKYEVALRTAAFSEVHPHE